MTHKIWIIKEYYDDYDQHGGYFLAAFQNEPTEENLKPFHHSYFGKKKHDQCWVEKDEEELYYGDKKDTN